MKLSGAAAVGRAENWCENKAGAELEAARKPRASLLGFSVMEKGQSPKSGPIIIHPCVYDAVQN